jgi:small GTP-binding protein
MNSGNLDTAYMYKFVVIGDSGSGKTNIVTRFSTNEFYEASRPTIGVDFFQKDMLIPWTDGKKDEVRVQIWDSAGQERFRGVVSSHYKRAAGILLVYDITNRNSFLSVEKWLQEIQINSEPDVEIVLIGNKKDLVADRQVKLEEGLELANKQRLRFFETSAKENKDRNIDIMFEELTKVVHAKEKRREAESEVGSRNIGNMEGKNLDVNRAKRKTKKDSSDCC